jgi:hypothetical protein
MTLLAGKVLIHS